MTATVGTTVMTALEFQASLGSDGTVKVPDSIVPQLKSVESFRVVLLVPSDPDDTQKEDEAWDRAAEAELFRSYSETDSIYDDV